MPLQTAKAKVVHPHEVHDRLKRLRETRRLSEQARRQHPDPTFVPQVVPARIDRIEPQPQPEPKVVPAKFKPGPGPRIVKPKHCEHRPEPQADQRTDPQTDQPDKQKQGEPTEQEQHEPTEQEPDEVTKQKQDEPTEQEQHMPTEEDEPMAPLLKTTTKAKRCPQPPVPVKKAPKQPSSAPLSKKPKLQPSSKPSKPVPTSSYPGSGGTVIGLPEQVPIGMMVDKTGRRDSGRIPSMAVIDPSRPEREQVPIGMKTTTVGNTVDTSRPGQKHAPIGMKKTMQVDNTTGQPESEQAPMGMMPAVFVAPKSQGGHRTYGFVPKPVGIGTASYWRRKPSMKTDDDDVQEVRSDDE